MKPLKVLKFCQRLFYKSSGDSRRKRLIARIILTILAIGVIQNPFSANSIPLESSLPSLSSSILSPITDNSDNLDDSILLPENSSVAEDSDQDLISPGLRKLMYLGVFILFTGIILIIGVLSKQIARALIGASLLTVVFCFLFFIVI